MEWTHFSESDLTLKSCLILTCRVSDILPQLCGRAQNEVESVWNRVATKFSTLQKRLWQAMFNYKCELETKCPSIVILRLPYYGFNSKT